MAAVLITDLVGSTELMATIGQDEFRDFLGDHFARLGDVVDQHRGTRIKTLGDGILATFPSATDAVGCAVALQQTVDRRGRPGGAPVAMRVGLALGEVGVDDGDVLGTPVVEAARLAAAAGGGQILASDVVRMVCDDPGRALFVEVGDLTLKGLPHPVAAYEVAWKRLPLSAVPLPALLTDIGPIFVGRDADLERFQAVWDDAGSGDLRLLLLSGEPGVGKTRLAAEMASRAHQAGSTVLAGRCDEDLPVPHQPFVEALRHFVDHSPDAGLGESLGRYGGELTRLLPELAVRVPDLPPPIRSDPETEQYRLFDAVAAWLGRAAAERQLLLLLDDLQWAAKASLLLLRHLLRSAGLGRVVVVGTYRDTELTHDHPLVGLLADLRRHPRVSRLSLDGLVEADVMAFVEQAAGHRLVGEGEALARAIHAETQGNPFFLREVLRHLVETGAVVVDGGKWNVSLAIEDVGIPEGVREVVGRRLARLSGAANTVLKLAAVLGTDFDLAELQAAGDLDEEAVLSALEEALEARLLIEPAGPTSRYRFSHALIRETVYGELSAARRVVLHRRIGEAIESLYGGRLDEYLPALAHHYGHASVPTAASAKALAYAIGAGDRAVAQMANDQAASYYLRALEMLEIVDLASDDARRLDLLLRLGDAQRLAGDPAHRETLLAAGRLAAELGDADALARSALANHRGLWATIGAVDEERVAMLHAALDAQDPVDSTVRARLLANLAVEVVYGRDPDRGRVLSAEALAMSRRLGDRATLAAVLRSRVVAIWAPTTVDERLAHTRELLDVAGELGDSVLVCAGSWHRFVAAMEAGDVAEADRCLGAAELLADELGQPTARWFSMILRANRLLVAGEVDRSEAVSHQALELGLAAGHPDAVLLNSVHVFNVCFERGTLGTIAEAVARVTAANPGVTSLQATLTLLHAELGQLDQARAAYEPLLGQLPELRQEPYWLRTMSQTAYVCHQLGDRPGARILIDLLAPFEGQTVCTGLSWAGSVSYYVGLMESTLGHLDRADASLARAEAVHLAFPAPTWLARTHLARAGVLLERGSAADAEQARALLEQALATSRRLGLASLERRTAAALAAT
jgi:class 3 adenylate cyclase/tetratricopeptide (TPR) repeat protein